MKKGWILYLVTCLFCLSSTGMKANGNDVATGNQDDPVLTEADEMPLFPGGEGEMLKFISRSIRYPVEAVKEKKQGRVVVSFIVEKDGSITHPTVKRGIDKSLDEEAVRVIKEMPKWTPAKHNGEVVRLEYTLPVVFRIS